LRHEQRPASPAYPRIHFDRKEMPARAAIVTGHGLVRVEWLEVAGDRCWSSSGTGDAKREAVTAIERIEEMCESMH